VKNTEEAQKRMDEMAAERDDIKNNLEQKVDEFKKETERMEKAAAEERAAIRKEGDDKVKAIQREIDEKNKEIAMLEEKMKHVSDDLENAKAAEDSAYAEMLMVKSNMDTMAEQQKVRSTQYFLNPWSGCCLYAMFEEQRKTKSKKI
jgi:chromosome segregation ATPase